MVSSIASLLASLPDSERQATIRTLSPEAAALLRYRWDFIARPNQLPPKDRPWRVWLIMAGRGAGKTRTGAEWVKEQARLQPESRGGLVGRTTADTRDTMIEGESGILAISDPAFRPTYEPSKRRLVWPNGTQATTYSADEPNLLRGPAHHWVWGDELAAWKYPDAWDQALFGLRLGDNPCAVVTTTPRPVRVIRELVKQPTTVVTHGSTYDNRDNLPEVFLSAIISRYEGTTLGRQEIYAELLDEAPGALWLRSTLDRCRVQSAPAMRRIVVAIDPAMTAKEGSDETGIVVAGIGEDKQGYLLADLSCLASSDRWARIAVEAYHGWKADRIVAEVNQGGDLVGRVLRHVDENVSYLGVHATKGKYTRAEPIAALYEQTRIHHVGTFSDLEDQLCNFVPGVSDGSPDRLDALVWAMTDLMEGGSVDRLRLDSAGYEPSAWRV